jgi:uroporphyrinogen-III synthase
MSFNGLRVLSLESRRAREIEHLIRAKGGDPFVAPSMREVPLENNPAAFAFAERLFRGEFEMMILLTGVGSRLLAQILATRYPENSFADALRKLAVVVRGPKPAAVMREWNVPVAVLVPEPNTWREVLAAIKDRPERRIAIQEYGRPSDELIAGLAGREVTTVPVYQWDLPEDQGPLREAVKKLASGDFDVLMLTTSIQVAHLFRIADESGQNIRPALSKMMIASVGPTTSETLVDYGLRADFEPTHPKMGFLVNEAAARAHQILRNKRA